MIHPFTQDISNIPCPTQFTYPFHYTPHPLCVLAAQEVQTYLQSRTDWHCELQQGKMFGVLVVRTPEGTTGWLAAFSGNLAAATTTNISFHRFMTCWIRMDISSKKRQGFPHSMSSWTKWRSSRTPTKTKSTNSKKNGKSAPSLSSNGFSNNSACETLWAKNRTSTKFSSDWRIASPRQAQENVQLQSFCNTLIFKGFSH